MKQTTATKTDSTVHFESNPAYEALALEYTADKEAFAHKYSRVQLISVIAYLRAKAKAQAVR
jgi:hypothetical protein